MACFAWSGRQGPLTPFLAYICADDATVVSGPPGVYGGTLYLQTTNNGVTGIASAACTEASVTRANLSSCGPNCLDIDPDEPYDCVNGGCVPKTTYNTPGVFRSLAACQSGCARNSDCTGECITTEEIAALRQAANCLQTRYCG